MADEAQTPKTAPKAAPKKAPKEEPKGDPRGEMIVRGGTKLFIKG